MGIPELQIKIMIYSIFLRDTNIKVKKKIKKIKISSKPAFYNTLKFQYLPVFFLSYCLNITRAFSVPSVRGEVLWCHCIVLTANFFIKTHCLPALSNLTPFEGFIDRSNKVLSSNPFN